MNLSFRCIAFVAVLSSPIAAWCEEDVLTRWHLDAPFWESTVVFGESMFFQEHEAGQPAWSRLLFTPVKIRSVVHPATGATYEEGRDYTVDATTKRLTLTADSRIPFTTRANFEPALGQSGQLYRDETRDIFFGAGPFFHNLQVEVTYEHNGQEWAAMNGPVPASAASLLPDLMAKLVAKEALTVCLLGDSISYGLDASSMSDTPPQMPSYGELFAQGLSARFGSAIDFTNFSVSGMAAPWGIEQVPAVVEKNPDLVIIAFGMNDASGKRAPEDFAANIQTIMTDIKAVRPQASFILVASMRGNPEWKHAAPEFHPLYRDALLALQGPGVAVADLTSIWTTLLEHKTFADITGNGVNHPNDFGHRVHAEVLLALLPVASKG